MLKKKTRLILSLILVILCLFVIATFAIVKSSEAGMQKLLDTSIQSINMQNIPDGIFLGERDAFPINVKVEVHVKNHEIVEINLIKHTNGQGKPAEVIIDSVIKDQTLEVDSIAGATYSSKAILLAIENAMINDMEE